MLTSQPCVPLPLQLRHGRPGAVCGLLYSDEAEMGRRMTAPWFGLPRGAFAAAFSTNCLKKGDPQTLLPPLLTSQRRHGGNPQAQVTGMCSGRSCFGTRLATDWSWTGPVVYGTAGRGTAALAACGAVMTSVSCSPSEAILYSHGPCK